MKNRTKPTPPIPDAKLIGPATTARSVAVDQLAAAEQADLQRLEIIIERGVGTFIEVARALAEIKQKRLFVGYATFEEYCNGRWEFGPSYRQRLLDAAQVVEILPMGKNVVLPTNERQVRPLVLLSNANDVRNAWDQALKVAGEKPVTGKIVASTVHKLIDSGAGRRTAKRPTRKARPKIEIAAEHLQEVERLLDEVRIITAPMPVSSRVLDLLAQIDEILPEIPEGAKDKVRVEAHALAGKAG